MRRSDSKNLQARFGPAVKTFGIVIAIGVAHTVFAYLVLFNVINSSPAVWWSLVWLLAPAIGIMDPLGLGLSYVLPLTIANGLLYGTSWLLLLRWVWRRLAPPLSHGFCPRCGYDLRATPGPACPECGWPNLYPSPKPLARVLSKA